VNVVRHDARTNDRQRYALIRFGDQPQKCGVVGPIMKPLELIVAAVDDVVTVIRNDGT
jgi:hypothetical protein